MTTVASLRLGVLRFLDAGNPLSNVTLWRLSAGIEVVILARYLARPAASQLGTLTLRRILPDMGLKLRVDGRDVEVADDGASLLEVLRDRLGVRSPKDGCSPQGQCGCCTVLIEGEPRMACVTPARRVRGRSVVTLEGFPYETQQRWAKAFLAAGASQCGFCTPGIIVRLAALASKSPGTALSPAEIERALAAHLCRCTGWRSIIDAAVSASSPPVPPAAVAALPPADLKAPVRSEGAPVGSGGAPPSVSPALPQAQVESEEVSGSAAGAMEGGAPSRRAQLEGGAAQRVGTAVVLGHGGFADDAAPRDALVAIPDGHGGWAVAETLTAARTKANKVQGRRTTMALGHPLAVPPGDWALTLRTTWVEPAYLEPDASWCVPGGEPASPLANGGAFGAKLVSPAPAAARMLADLHGRPVRVLLAREDTVRLGPKRPPVSAGIGVDGTGVVRVVRTAGIARAIAAVAPRMRVEACDVPGPPTDVTIRAAGWAEAAVLVAALRWTKNGRWPTIVAPNGALAAASVDGDDIFVRLACGPELDPVVLHSYVVGAAHQALSWVTSEGLSVDAEGVVHDLTVRSFGIVPARRMPSVEVECGQRAGAELAAATGAAQPSDPVNGSDAVFAAVAAAIWIQQGLVQDWPTNRGGNG